MKNKHALALLRKIRGMDSKINKASGIELAALLNMKIELLFAYIHALKSKHN